MLRRIGLLTPHVLSAALVLSAAGPALAEPPEHGAQSAHSSAAEAPAVHIFVAKPADLEALWKKLADPDFIFLTGDEYRKRTEREREDHRPDRLPATVVESVEIRGDVVDDLANLTVRYGVALDGEGPSWVTLRLDDQVLVAVNEGDDALPTRYVAGKGWQIELSGRGRHVVSATLKTRLKTTGEVSRLECAIPEAARTDFELDLPVRVSDAQVGPAEPVDHHAISAGQRTRLSAKLTPRARLAVSWRVEAEPGGQLPPLLAIQGEIAIDIESGSFRTRSSWMIHAIRGSAKALEFRLDSADEVLEVELDGQNPPSSIEGGTKLTINLIEPLQPGAPKRLTMTTRRSLATGPADVVAFRGFPLLNAREQSGAVGIVKSGNLWVEPVAGRGLRRVDPRDLPAELRARPATSIAYLFADQPFELSLRVEPSSPLIQVEGRTMVSLSAADAQVDTRLDYRTAPGRLFEVKVALPRGLELVSVGPDEVVESFKLIPVTPQGTGSTGEETRVLSVLLKTKAREQGVFPLRLVGRQTIDPARAVAIALFEPLETTPGRSRVAVVTESNLTVEWTAGPGLAGVSARFRPAGEPAPPDWPWPVERTASEVPPLWLLYDGTPTVLPLQVKVHPRALRQTTILGVKLGRREVEVRQETECAVRFGSLTHVDIAVPSELVNRWSIENGEVERRDDLGTSATGERIVRVKFTSAITGKLSLVFRFRLPLAPPLPAARPTEITVPWLRVPAATAEPMRARVASEAGINPEPLGRGWVRETGEEPGEPGEAGPPIRFTLVNTGAEPAPLRLKATAQELASLPALVVSRHLVQVVQGPTYALRTTAWFWVETHEGSLPVALPAGADWVLARVGGEPIEEIETVAGGAGYRLRFPPRWGGSPVLVQLEYTLPPRLAAAPWQPPRLLDGGLITETRWQVRLPRGWAVVGVPAGWSDENEWYWDRYVWKRRPRRNGPDLSAWVEGPSAQVTGPIAAPDEDRTDDQTYLFGRPGPPSELAPWVASRAGLVAVCSGTVLGLGSFLLLVWRPPARLLTVALAALALASAVALERNAVFLMVQSAAIGVVLTALAAVMHWLIENRRPARGMFGEASGLSPAPASGSSLNQAPAAGSDDSTAIRIRPASTVDYIVAAPTVERPGGGEHRVPSASGGDL